PGSPTHGHAHPRAVLHILPCRALHCQRNTPSCFHCVAEQGFSQTRQSIIRCSSLLFFCPFGATHRPAGKLPRVSEPSGISGGISFQPSSTSSVPGWFADL